MLRKIFLLLSFFFFLHVNGDNVRYGLTFNSHSVNQDLRTSLNLTPYETLSFPNGFSVEFSIKFNPGIQTYGYVCRFISDDSQTFDIISNINGRKLNCVLIDVDKALANVNFQIENSTVRKDWYKIRIDFRPEKIICNIDEEVQVMPHSFSGFKNIRLYFGSNKDKIYYSSDVPPISIKDVLIKDEKGNSIYSWKMDKNNGDKVFDSIRKKEATVENGVWEIDKYIEWNKDISASVMGRYPQMAFDSINNIFYIATSDSLVSVGLKDRSIIRKETIKGSPYAASTGGQLIYDNKRNRLVSYSHLYPDLIFYNFQINEWSGENQDQRFANAHQHNHFIDSEKDRLVTFGGYGYQTYKAWVSLHNLDGGEWVINDLADKIAPRYLSALGNFGEGKFLILGGYGSISGKQEESPKNFYDLYEIDSRNLTCKKLFDLEFPMKPLVFSNSMVVDKKNNKIYALGFNNSRFNTFLNLCEISLTDGSVAVLADSIPYNFMDMESFCDLILDTRNSVLYTVLLQKSSGTNTLDIYSLSYPPLKISDVTQSDISEANDKESIPLLYFVLLFILLLAIVVYLIRIRKRKPVSTNDNTIEKQTHLPREGYHSEAKSFSTIKLIGGFQVFSKDGLDITDSFTPILKQLFLFILLSSIKNGKKITSEKLDEKFWYQMDKASASNNRSVNVRKLRLLLEKIGNVVLSNKRSYWFIDLQNDIYCDYREIMLLFKQIKDAKNIPLHTLEKTLEIAKEGILLPNLNVDWIDDYKNEYSSTLIDLLSKATMQPDINADQKLLLKIANVMLLHDNIDEEAITIKCRALFLLGQKGLSKQTFDKFAQDYQNLLNEPPKIRYEDIVS